MDRLILDTLKVAPADLAAVGAALPEVTELVLERCNVGPGSMAAIAKHVPRLEALEVASSAGPGLTMGMGMLTAQRGQRAKGGALRELRLVGMPHYVDCFEIESMAEEFGTGVAVIVEHVQYGNY